MRKTAALLAMIFPCLYVSYAYGQNESVLSAIAAWADRQGGFFKAGDIAVVSDHAGKLAIEMPAKLPLAFPAFDCTTKFAIQNQTLVEKEVQCAANVQIEDSEIRGLYVVAISYLTGYVSAKTENPLLLHK